MFVLGCNNFISTLTFESLDLNLFNIINQGPMIVKKLETYQTLSNIDK